MARTDEQLYDLLVGSKCYVDTVEEVDKSKVSRRRQGIGTNQPRSNIGLVAWELGYRAWQQEQVSPLPPPPPPPPTTDPTFGIAPRTYNYAPSNNSDPLFCKHSPGVVVNADGTFSDKYSRYDTNGKDIDGRRDRLYRVNGLNDSDNTNGLDPCTLYNGMTKWPEDSYHR